MRRKEKYAAHQVELAHQQQQKKKQKRILLFWLSALCIPQLLFFPAVPRFAWEYDLYQNISQHLHISIGANGSLPFFTMLSSLYTGGYVFVLIAYWLIGFIRTHGLGQQFQPQYYQLFFNQRSKHADKFPIMDHSAFKIISVSLLLIFGLILGLFHFVLDNISVVGSSHKGYLFSVMYNLKIGVIFCEFIFSLFYLVPILYFLLLIIYLINIARGMGTGKTTATIPPEKKKT